MLAPALSSVFSRPIGQFSSFYQQTQTNSARLDLAGAETKGGYDGFKVFDQLLQRGYEALRTPSRYESAVESGPAVSADRILGFIERRLQQDVAEGASQEALASRLEAGLEGFEKGFEEARRQLDGLGLLTAPVAQEIGATYDRVLAGVEALREKFLTAEDAEAPIAVAPPSGGVTGLAGFSDYSYGQRNSFSFELETADGDTVRIQATAQELFAVQAQFAAVRDGEQVAAGLAFAATSGNSQQFSLRVEGELDSDELAAINDLLGKVNELSGQFFGGDLEGAFNSALNIGYDSNEIVSFALNLSRVEVERVTTAYQQFEGPGVYAGPALSNSLAPLGNFTRDLLDALELASPFEQPRQLVRDLADRVGLLDDSRPADDSKRFGPFVERMLGSLEQV